MRLWRGHGRLGAARSGTSALLAAGKGTPRARPARCRPGRRVIARLERGDSDACRAADGWCRVRVGRDEGAVGGTRPPRLGKGWSRLVTVRRYGLAGHGKARCICRPAAAGRGRQCMLPPSLHAQDGGREVPRNLAIQRPGKECCSQSRHPIASPQDGTSSLNSR